MAWYSGRYQVAYWLLLLADIRSYYLKVQGLPFHAKALLSPRPMRVPLSWYIRGRIR
jgi:hypothetical protein